jgi:hypothetical protein
MVITIHHDRALLSEIQAEEQFLLMLPSADSGAPVVKAILQTRIAEPPFYHRRKHLAGKGVAEIRRLKPIEDESAGLSKLKADLTGISFLFNWPFHDLTEEVSGGGEFNNPSLGRSILGRGVASGWVNI